MKKQKTRIAKFTVGRLYNLGSYEHVRYELTIEVPEGESATKAFQGVERLFVALNPKAPALVPSVTEIAHDKARIDRMRELLLNNGKEEFNRQHCSYVGTPKQYIARCQKSLNESIKRRQAWEARSRKARQMLEDLGGAAKWRDAKLEWDDDNDYF
jgi:hypothetical protein